MAEVTVVGEPAKKAPGVTFPALDETVGARQPEARLVVQECTG